MKFISSLKESKYFKKVLYYLVLGFSFLYIFCVPSFGESSFVLRLITIYGSMFCLGVFSIFYCFLYDDLKLNKIVFLIPSFAVFAFIGTAIYSKDFASWFSLFLLSASCFVFIYSFKTIKNKYVILSIIASAFFAFSLYFIIYFRNEILSFSSFESESFRLGPPFDNQNGVAAYAIIGVATSLYLVLFLNEKIRYVFIIPVLTSLLVGISTGSRTFILALVVFIVVFLYFKFKKHKFIYLIVLAASIGLGVILLNLPFMETMKDRIIRGLGTIFGFGTRVDTSTVERAIWIDYGFTLGSKNAIVGFGVNGFSIVSGVDTYAHSNYAEVFCDFGIIGFLLFYAPLVIFFIKSFIDKKIDKSLIIPFFAYYVIVSISNVIYYKKVYYLILAFLFFLTFIENREYKKVPLIEELHRVVFTCDTMGNGGAERVIATLANQMSDFGIEIKIVGVADTNAPTSFYRLNDTVDYLSLCSNNKRINSFKRVIMLRKLFKELNPDVVISFLPNANVYSWLSLIGTNIPHIVSERNNPYVDPQNKLLRFLKRNAFYFANGCVFQTNGAKRFFNKKTQKNSIVIPNPISLSYYPNQFCDKKENTVLAVGRFFKQKNYRCLVDAFKQFNDSHFNRFTLKIYGDGPLKQEIMDYCKTIGISQYTNFAGSDNDWHSKEFKDAVYVLSSDYEGMPNSLAEAMALGIPSISTDCPCGGPRELIQDGINGFLVGVNDSAALAKKMDEAIRQKSLVFYTNTRNMLYDYSIENTSKKWVAYLKGLYKLTYE